MKLIPVGAIVHDVARVDQNEEAIEMSLKIVDRAHQGRTIGPKQRSLDRFRRSIGITSLLFLFVAGSAWARSGSQSYWGPIAAAPDSADSSRMTFRDAPRSIGEGILYWPVRIAAEPLVLLADGMGAAAEYLDERKVLYRVGKLLAPRTGPFGVLIGVQAGGLAGFGGGLTLEHDAFFGRGNSLRVRASTTANEDTRASIGFRRSLGNSNYLEFGTGYRERSNARFFGLGPETNEQDESFYRQELGWAGTALHREVLPHVFAEGDLLYSGVSAGEPRSDTPSISTVFAGRIPNGFGRRSNGLSLGLQLSHENESGEGRTTKGGSRRVRIERFEGTGDEEAAFWSYRAELQQFFTLWHPYRVLALRAYGSWLDPVGSAEIPFTRLLINDTPDALRGFRSFRFRDRGLVALNTDYRFPLLTKARPGGPGLDLYPLADWGQIFHRTGEISARNMTLSYGLGIRLESSNGLVARVEWARSEEETTWILRADQIFQFMKLGFLYGRDPIPAR